MSPRVFLDQFEFLIKNLTPLPGLPDMVRLFDFLPPLTCDSLKPVLGSVGTTLAASIQNRTAPHQNNMGAHARLFIRTGSLALSLYWQHIGNRIPPVGAARLTKPAFFC